MELLAQHLYHRHSGDQDNPCTGFANTARWQQFASETSFTEILASWFAFLGQRSLFKIRWNKYRDVVAGRSKIHPAWSLVLAIHGYTFTRKITTFHQALLPRAYFDLDLPAPGQITAGNTETSDAPHADYCGTIVLSVHLPHGQTILVSPHYRCLNSNVRFMAMVWPLQASFRNRTVRHRPAPKTSSNRAPPPPLKLHTLLRVPKSTQSTQVRMLFFSSSTRPAYCFEHLMSPRLAVDCRRRWTG